MANTLLIHEKLKTRPQHQQQKSRQSELQLQQTHKTPKLPKPTTPPQFSRIKIQLQDHQNLLANFFFYNCCNLFTDFFLLLEFSVIFQ